MAFLSQNIASLLFFIPYILFQPPSTILVRKLGARLHLSVITLLWGSVMIGMGFSRSFGDLAGMRVALGVLEAGFFPSCVYLLSTWYTRCMSMSLSKPFPTSSGLRPVSLPLSFTLLCPSLGIGIGINH